MNLDKVVFTKEDMYTDWLWQKTYRHFRRKAIKNVEKEHRWWNWIKEEEYNDEHRRLFWTWYSKLKLSHKQKETNNE